MYDLLSVMLIGGCACAAEPVEVSQLRINHKEDYSTTQCVHNELVAHVCDGCDFSEILQDIDIKYLECCDTAVVSYVKESATPLRCYHVLVRCAGVWFKTGSLSFPAAQDPVDSVDYYCGRLVFWDKRMQQIPYGVWPVPQAAIDALKSDNSTSLKPLVQKELYPFLLTEAALQGASSCMEMLLTEEIKALQPADAALLRAFVAVWRGDTAALQQCMIVPRFKVNEQLFNFGYNWESHYNLLYLAILNGHTDCVRLLLQQPGINPNGRVGLSSPLHAAVSINNVEIVSLLLGCRGIDVNIRSSMGYHGYLTPLHDAASNGRIEIVRLLLSAPGIDVNAIDKGGSTALDLAKKQGYTECAELLRSALE